MTEFVVGVWVVTLAWLVAGFVVFHFAIERALRDKGVPAPSGLRTPDFIGNQSRELTAYRTQRLRLGRGLAWWRFMMLWRFLFALLALVSILVTFLAALEVV